jgi:protein CWC15
MKTSQFLFRPSHTSLKSRDRGQNNPDDLTGRDFRRELEERERAAVRDRESGPNKRER